MDYSEISTLRLYKQQNLLKDKRYTIFLHQHYSTYFKFRRHYLHQIQWRQTKIHNTK